MTQPEPRNMADLLRVLLGDRDRADDRLAATPLIGRLSGHFPGKAVGGLHVITADSTVKHLPDEAMAIAALIQVVSQPVRWCVGPDEPTTAEAFRTEPGTFLEVTGWADLRSFRFRNDGTFDATLLIQFFV